MMTLCPHCQRDTEVYLVSCDGNIVETHRCRNHGDVVPSRRPIGPCKFAGQPHSEDPGVYRTTQEVER